MSLNSTLVSDYNTPVLLSIIVRNTGTSSVSLPPLYRVIISALVSNSSGVAVGGVSPVPLATNQSEPDVNVNPGEVLKANYTLVFTTLSNAESSLAEYTATLLPSSATGTFPVIIGGNGVYSVRVISELLGHSNVTSLPITVAIGTQGSKMQPAANVSPLSPSSTSWGVGYWMKSNALGGDSWSQVSGIGGDLYVGPYSVEATTFEVLSVILSNDYLLQLSGNIYVNPTPVQAWVGVPNGGGFKSATMGYISSRGWYTFNIYYSSSNWWYSYNTINPTTRQSNGNAKYECACNVYSIPTAGLNANQIPLILESYTSDSSDYTYNTITFGILVYSIGPSWYWANAGYVYACYQSNMPNYGTTGGILISSCAHVPTSPNPMAFGFNYVSSAYWESSYYISNDANYGCLYSTYVGTELYPSLSC